LGDSRREHRRLHGHGIVKLEAFRSFTGRQRRRGTRPRIEGTDAALDGDPADGEIEFAVLTL
jgi:hypothetical protein